MRTSVGARLAPCMHWTEKLFAREERSSASLDHVSSEKLSTAIKVRKPEDLDFLCFHSSPSAPFCFYSFCLLDDVWIHPPVLQADLMSRIWLHPGAMEVYNSVSTELCVSIQLGFRPLFWLQSVPLDFPPHEAFFNNTFLLSSTI